MRGRPHHYIVYFDTNCLRGHGILQEGLKPALESIANEEVIKIQYRLPEVVRDEWIQFFVDIGNSHIDKIKTAHAELDEMKISGHKVSVPLEKELYEMGKKYLAELGFSTITTPYARINLKNLTQRAIKHQSPFTPKKDAHSEVPDKGIKDAIIAHTIDEDIKKSKDSGKAFVILVRDTLLKSYLTELLPNEAGVIYFESVNDLQNDIKLRANELGDELADEAAVLIYNASSVLEDLKSKALAFYRGTFSNPTLGAKYVDDLDSSGITSMYPSLKLIRLNSNVEFGINRLKVGETTFDKRDGSKLSWSTRVIFEQDYNSNDETSSGTIISNPTVVTHCISFKVDWDSNLDGDKLTGVNITSMNALNETKKADPFGGLYSNYLDEFSTSAKKITDSAIKLRSDALPVLTSITQFAQPVSDLYNASKFQALRTLLNIGPTKPFWDNKPDGSKII